MEFVERLDRIESSKRMAERCRAVKEELMAICWHAKRLARIIESHPADQWNHEMQQYGELEFTTADEIF